MSELRLALIQSDLLWENPEGNIEQFSKWMKKIDQPTDMIVLPETFATGFTSRPDVCAESMSGNAVNFMKQIAVEKNSIVFGSLLIQEECKYFNRCICAFPDNTLSWYDKKHLFRMSDEYKVFTSGSGKMIVKSDDWKIQPMICYDLRFPVWTRNTFIEENFGYDVLVFVANWPASRSHVWKSLLIARAIENQSYVVGVNRIGEDGFGTPHSGDSLVVDPKGKILLDASSDPGVFEITLHLNDLISFRKSFPIAYDWDLFRIEQ